MNDTSQTPCWEPEIGETAGLRHERFGRVEAKVTAYICDTWADIEVVSGTLRGMGAGAVWGPNARKRVRRSHCRWYPNAQHDAGERSGANDE